jgi:hypothetical protein
VRDAGGVAFNSFTILFTKTNLVLRYCLTHYPYGTYSPKPTCGLKAAFVSTREVLKLKRPLEPKYSLVPYSVQVGKQETFKQVGQLNTLTQKQTKYSV